MDEIARESWPAECEPRDVARVYAVRCGQLERENADLRLKLFGARFALALVVGFVAQIVLVVAHVW